jgi:hypothetical protein
MTQDVKMLTRREVAEYLSANGYPISAGTLGKLCARDEGPPHAGIWRGQFQYEPGRALAWARSRLRMTELSRGRRDSRRSGA